MLNIVKSSLRRNRKPEDHSQPLSKKMVFDSQVETVDDGSPYLDEDVRFHLIYEQGRSS